MDENKWTYYDPVFESDQYEYEMMRFSPWSGHRRFAYDLVCNYRPERMVELGSYYGCSTFAFMQAIKDCGLPTDFYAVDSWEGDSYTAEDYREDIFADFSRIYDSAFRSTGLQILRKTFDEAVVDFDDGTVDILHIDGSHDYTDVKHDYEAWKSKVKKDGLILFHDIGKTNLFEAPLGSAVFWSEMTKEAVYSIEFPFSFGLGVLTYSKERYEKFLSGIDVSYYQELANIDAEDNKDDLRKKYFIEEGLKRNIDILKEEKQVQQEHLDRYEHDVAEKDGYIASLEEQAQEFLLVDKSLRNQLAHREDENNKSIAQFKENLAGKEAYIEELLQQIRYINEQETEKLKYIAELESDKESTMSLLQKKEQYITQLETEMESLNEFAGEKEEYIAELQEDMLSLQGLLADKEKYIRELEENRDSLNGFAQEKEEVIASLKEQMDSLNAYAEGKSSYADELEASITAVNDLLEVKEQYIKELEEAKKKLHAFVDIKESYIGNLENRIKAIETMLAKRKSIDKIIS